LKEKKCYIKVLESSKNCEEKECRYFLNSSLDLNCSLHAAYRGPMTLEEIGQYYNISRMRICQIEKSILNKLKKTTSKNII
jgi:hypothetical protein